MYVPAGQAGNRSNFLILCYSAVSADLLQPYCLVNQCMDYSVDF